jgi:uncharacterized protein YdiU (UPF0061 family)
VNRYHTVYKIFCTSLLKTNTKVCLEVLTIGGHHAEAVSRALAERGATVLHLSMPHYRVGAVQCGKIEEALKTLKISKDTVIMLQVFDSGFYMVRTEEGSLIPPAEEERVHTTSMVYWSS